jgi:ADP-ribose pyrophosphatase YjhB (NUDIX family)
MERTMDAAKRELREETGLNSELVGDNKNHHWALKWHEDGPFACSDSISAGFHYVISQCFAEVAASSQPQIEASDDAMDAKWWSADEVEVAESKGFVTQGVLKVLKRSEALYEKGLL